MARKWFQHDYDARCDDKMLELRAELGWKGYGLFYGCLELMCQNEKGYLEVDKIGGLSVAFSLPRNEMSEFVDLCVDIGLFTKDEDGKIRNNRITKHIEKMKSFSEAGKKGAEKRWSKDSNRGASNKASSNGNTGVSTDKSRIDKSIKENTLLFDLQSNDFDMKGSVEEKINWTTVRFHERIRDRFGHHKNVKNATLEKWRDPIRLMNSEDELEFQQIWEYIAFAVQDDFWKDTVLSTSGLRNNWEKIDAAIKRSESKKSGSMDQEVANSNAYQNDFTGV